MSAQTSNERKEMLVDNHEEQLISDTTKQDEEDVFQEDTQEYAHEDVMALNKEKLIILTKRAIEKESERKANVNKIDPILFDQRVREFACNIVEWTHISATAGEWNFTYGMHKVDEKYLAPTAREVKRILPDVMVMKRSGKSRHIYVTWQKSNEV